VLIDVGAAQAQFDAPVMIEASAEPLPVQTARFVGKSQLTHRPPPPWSVEADFLGLVHDDEQTILFGGGTTAERVIVQSDSMSGIRLAVSRSLGQSRGQTQAGVWEAVVVGAHDENQYLINSENWTVTSRLTTIEANGGLESTVFGVRTRMLVGGRYASIGDEYERDYGPGFSIHDDLVEASNHAGYAQGKLALNWERGRWSLAAALAGGFGLNAAHQAGDVFANPLVNSYKTDEWSFSALTELTTRASVQLFGHTHLQVGFYGLTTTEMASSRRGLGGEGGLSDARYVGLFVGVRQCF